MAGTARVLAVHLVELSQVWDLEVERRSGQRRVRLVDGDVDLRLQHGIRRRLTLEQEQAPC